MSFYPTKVLSAAGDGGWWPLTIQTGASDPCFGQSWSHGWSVSSSARPRGGNSRLDIHAATLLAHLPQLASRMARRQDIYRRFRNELGTAVLEHDADSPVSILCVRHPRRDAIREHLNHRGIATGCYYPVPLHQHPAINGARLVGDLSEAVAFCSEAFAIPVPRGLTDDQVGQILDAMREVSLIDPLLYNWVSGFVVVLGLLLGSFLNVCIARMPEDRSIVSLPHCPACGHQIRPWDNIPIISLDSLCVVVVEIVEQASRPCTRPLSC